MVSKEEFENFCAGLLTEQEINDFNSKKKKQWTILMVVGIIEFVVAVVLPLFFSRVYLTEYILFSFFFFVFAFIVTVGVVLGVSNSAWNEIKIKKSEKILNFLLKDYEYNYEPKNFIPEDIFRKSGFGGFYDSYHGEDLLSIAIPNDDGSPSTTKLKISDLRVTKTTTDSKGHSHTTTIYSGLFGFVQFPFKFKCNLGFNVYKRGLEKIKLEDIEFNKRFRTSTDNQIEALCILTPTMIRKLLNFEKKAKYFKLLISKEGEMFFGFNGDLFAMSKQEKTLNGKSFENFYEDISIILSFIEEIKTNNKVFDM